MTPEPKIKGLTLRHPWAWGFLNGKPVENRTWRPERQGGSIGMYLALHGGAMPPKSGEYWNEITDAVNWMGHQGLPCAALARELLRDGRGLCVPGIVAVAQLVEVRQDSSSPWAAQGQYHWVLDVTPLPEPVLHKGSQGLWTVEPEALARVQAGYRAARKKKR
ncbi:hypothetical protein [Deinococcus sp. QL22]|uniref:hypothetical protein n=1 Tax=Deinococcus sp. QL22 TaxID=2939437 RepID=UPI002016D9BA|nr:hypothetical protein [Deinococcus sp. QL22]UQN10324.1 hypothetical protein M1R55_29675 [Deinococcus sp. QL22]UQN10458.1 hypothetical protein M1R55_29000 [Deinococcus sp. QL22]